MKKSIKRKWLKALRSGNYKQTQKTLKDNRGFCCLGVLCDISKLRKWRDYPKSPINFAMKYGREETSALPLAVQRWAGFKEENPIIRDPVHNMHKSLAELNDEGFSFEEIADLIEKNL